MAAPHVRLWRPDPPEPEPAQTHESAPAESIVFLLKLEGRPYQFEIWPDERATARGVPGHIHLIRAARGEGWLAITVLGP